MIGLNVINLYNEKSEKSRKGKKEGQSESEHTIKYA